MDPSDETPRSPSTLPAAGPAQAAFPALPHALAFTATRFAPPGLPDGWLDRPQLTGRLRRALRGPLTLVCAPAGFGKTSLLAATAPGTLPALAWYSLDKGDDDLATFWSGVIYALSRVAPGLEALLDMPLAPASALAYTLNGLIHLLGRLPQDTLLVLDNFHHAGQAELCASLAAFIQDLPPALHLALLTRCEPSLPLERWRAAGRLHTLDAAQLAFSPQETTRLLERLPGERLSPGARAQAARLEGWPAALRLYAIWLAEDPQAAAGQSWPPTLGDYLAQEVLAGLPQDLQDFLIDVCVLDVLTPPACQALTGRGPASAALQALQRRGLLSPLPAAGEATYRAPALLTNYVYQQLCNEHPVRHDSLHRRAAEYFRAQGLPDQALEHALQGGADRLAGDLLEELAPLRLRRGEFRAALRDLERLAPGERRRRPALVVAHAWALAHAGQMEKCRAGLDALAAATLAPRWQAEILAIRARLAVLSGDLTQAVVASQVALAALPADRPWLRAEVHMDLGFALLNGQDAAPLLEPAGEAFQHSLEEGLAAGHMRAAMMSAFYRGRTAMLQGDFHAAARLYRRMLDECTRRELPEAAGCWMHAGLGALFYEWDRRDESLAELQTALRLAERSGEFKVLVYANTALMRLYQAMGLPERADQVLAGVDEILRPMPIPAMQVEAGLQRSSLWAAQGRLEALEAWLQTQGYSLEQGRPLAAHNAMLLRLHVSQAIHRRRPLSPAARPVLEARLAAAVQGGQVWEQARLQTWQALLAWAVDDAARAGRHLEAALALAAPAGLVRTLADEGAPLGDLLRRAAPSVEAGALERLYAALPPQAAPPTTTGQDLIEPLRPREAEILALMAQGLSDQEIARQTVLALSTGKWHVSHIYQKLHVRRRTQAVARAREYRLLEG
ncbi:MAG: LuxR C-terminal-related transcriptional regulator [Anaerolineaceae bacterium]|nr:LuxR C-terminal-related transcriptional regulator [Anaerolineaceae bacterium]